MSLLLDALKKSEDKKAGSGLSIGGDSGAAEETKTVDFDSIPEAPSSLEDEAGARVVAGRVFSSGGGEDIESGADRGGGRGGKLVVLTLLISLLGGGTYFADDFGIINIERILGLEEEQQAQVAVAPRDELQFNEGTFDTSGDVVELDLPTPSVDVQRIIDFTGLTSPSGEETPEDIKQKLIVLTNIDDGDDAVSDNFFGLSGVDDVNLGVSALEEEDGELLEEEEEDLTFLGELEDTEDTVTDEVARSARRRADARTLFDQKIDIVGAVAKRGAGAAAAAAADTALASTQSEDVKVVQSTAAQDRDRDLDRARRLFLSGKIIDAESLYRKILQNDPTNIDALRGIAKIGSVTGKQKLAIATYLKILDYYPKDPVAISELVNLSESGDPELGISRIRSLIGIQPEADARLYFTIGNIYAGQRFWHRAQQAYFEAHSRDQGNPDYAFNLAVVLDYLRKEDLSLRYYKAALENLGELPGGFNASEVRARIKELSTQ